MRQQLLLSAFFAGAVNLLSGQAEQNAPELNRALSARIDSLKTEDQKYRNRLTELKNMSIPDEAEIKQAQEAILKTDSLNLIQVKRIFRQYGYPGSDLVGKQSAHNFWLIIQHCDQDPAFQEEVLGAMKQEVEKGTVSGWAYAYLTDRVLVNQDKPQVYGTQMRLNRDSTSYEPKPLIEPDKVDDRRGEMGLSPIAFYIETMNTRYFGSLKKE